MIADCTALCQSGGEGANREWILILFTVSCCALIEAEGIEFLVGLKQIICHFADLRRMLMGIEYSVNADHLLTTWSRIVVRIKLHDIIITIIIHVVAIASHNETSFPFCGCAVLHAGRCR